MRTKSTTIFCVVFSICANINTTANAQIPTDKQDSLALVDLYNSTAGASWTNNSNWLSGTVDTWFGITIDTGANKLRVRSIQLDNNNLTGTIPSSMENLKRLSDLDLHNNNLSGAIPAELGNLDKLKHLKLNNNQLTGTIPTSFGNLTKLKFLALSHNQLSGGIPVELGNLTNLTQLFLHQNQLTGAIPVELGNLANLTDLYLDHNQLSGAIPAELGNLANLTTLRLQNNTLSGAIPVEISNHFVSGQVDIARNEFTFDGMELLAQNSANARYSPQAHIPTNHGANNSLAVSAGGTLSNNTYNWYKATDTGNTKIATISGDSVFTPTESGSYFARITNSIATKLTLVSDTVFFDITLPVTILDLKAYPQKNIMTIAWTSVTEINVDRYEIQRSANALDFATIGTLAAKGNGVLKTEYSFNDVLPIKGNNFYRLKISDKDGKIAYSKIVSVNMSEQSISVIYPVPARNILFVAINGTATFSLMNQSGKILLTTTINSRGSINVSALAPGIYYLRNNTDKTVQKIVISR